MRTVVLDTNVLIDGSHDELSAARRIVDDVVAGRVQAAVSTPLRQEYEQLVHQTITDSQYREYLRIFLDRVTPVAVGNVPRVVPDDPEDDKVLATAHAAHADTLITNDRHLLTLDPHEGLRIVTPQAWLNLLAEEGTDGGTWSQFLRSIGIGPTSRDG